MADELRKLVTQLVADTKEWRRGLLVAGSELKQFERSTGSSLKSIGGLFGQMGSALGVSLSVGAMVGFGKAALDTADNVGDLAAAAGLGVEKFQRLQYAMSFSGVSASEFAGAMSNLQRVTGGAIAGQERAIKSFQMLGIDAEHANLALKTQDEVLDLVIEQLAGYGSQQERAAAAAKIFGDAVGPKFAAAAGQGTEALRALMDDAEVFTEGQVQAASKTQDKWDRMTSQFSTWWKSRVIDLIEEATDSLDRLPIEELERRLAVRRGAMAEDRAADMEGSPRPKILQQHHEKIAELEAMIARKRREAYEASPEGQEEAAKTRKRLADQAAAEREAEKLRTKAEREAEQEQREIERRREAAKRASYQAEYDELMKKYEREEELARRKGEVELEIERDTFERQMEAKRQAQQQLEALSKGAADTIADIATNGEEAFDRLKQRAIAAIAQIILKWAQMRALGGDAPGGNAPGGSVFGDILKQIIVGHAAGGSPIVGRAALVGESGPELFVPRTAGTIIPNGRMPISTGSGPTQVSLGVDVMIEPGMTATQEKRRGRDGQERARVHVRNIVQDELSRHGTMGRAVAAESGHRQAPRRGIS